MKAARARPVGCGKPVAEVVDYTGKKSGLRDAKEESQSVELRRGSNPCHCAREQTPGDRDTGDPAPSSYAREDHVTRHLK